MSMNVKYSAVCLFVVVAIVMLINSVSVCQYGDTNGRSPLFDLLSPMLTLFSQ